MHFMVKTCVRRSRQSQGSHQLALQILDHCCSTLLGLWFLSLDWIIFPQSSAFIFFFNFSLLEKSNQIQGRRGYIMKPLCSLPSFHSYQCFARSMFQQIPDRLYETFCSNILQFSFQTDKAFFSEHNLHVINTPPNLILILSCQIPSP